MAASKVIIYNKRLKHYLQDLCIFTGKDMVISNNKKRNRRFSRKHQIEKKREKRKRVKLNRKERIRKAKEEGPDQNAINPSSKGSQLFTNYNGINNFNDLYSMKRKGYRK